MVARISALVLAGLWFPGVASAHFVFVVPSADGQTAQVVFSEDLSPDPNVAISQVAGLKLRVFADGTESALEHRIGEQALLVRLPAGAGTRIVHGSLAYGVMKRGEGKPFLLLYHPRAVIGDPFADTAATSKPNSDMPSVPVIISTVGKPGQTQFLVSAAGKPLAGAEVHVLLPDGGKKKVATDADGRTPTFEATGRFGVWTRYVEASSGQLAEKNYEEIRHYPSLVVDVPAAAAGK